MSSCTYCHLAVYYVHQEGRPGAPPIVVDPIPVLYPGPGDLLVAVHTVTPTRGPSTKFGYRIAFIGQTPRGYACYVDHANLCERIVPDHPRRPPRAPAPLFGERNP